MAITEELPLNLRYKLADALLKCDCISTPENRNQLNLELPEEIRNRIIRGQDALSDVKGIVDGCSKVFEGVYRLYEAISRLEGPVLMGWIES